MHDDRTALAGETERPCWNCGATPNIRCCEFGREPRASSAARHEGISRDLATIEGAVTVALVLVSAAIVATVLWMVVEVLGVL